MSSYLRFEITDSLLSLLSLSAQMPSIPCLLGRHDKTCRGCADRGHLAAAESTHTPGPRSGPRALVALPALAHVVAWTAALLDAHFVGLAMQPAGRKVDPDLSYQQHLGPFAGLQKKTWRT